MYKEGTKILKTHDHYEGSEELVEVQVSADLKSVNTVRVETPEGNFQQLKF